MYTYTMWAETNWYHSREYDIRFTQGDFMRNASSFAEVENIRVDLEKITVESEYELTKEYMDINSGNVYAYCREDGIWQTMPQGTEYGWFLDEQDSLDSTLKYGLIRSQQAFPITLPIKQWLFRGDRGLYCRFEMHPELNGNSIGGKFYFPNKNCEHLCEGPAIITGVLDRGRYGFVDAHMEEFSIPDIGTLINFLLDEADKIPNGNIQKIRTPFGELIVISTENGVMKGIPIANPNPDPEFPEDNLRNRVDIISCIEDLPETEREVLETCGIKDYICKLAVDKTELEVQKMFRTCGFQFPDKFDDTVGETDPLMDEVLQLGIIRRCKIGTNSFYEINFDRLYEIPAQFDIDELEAIAATVNDLNDKTNKNITAQLKSGKLRLSL